MLGDLILFITTWWKQFKCIHNYKVDKMSTQLPMPTLYRCDKCDKWQHTRASNFILASYILLNIAITSFVFFIGYKYLTSNTSGVEELFKALLKVLENE